MRVIAPAPWIAEVQELGDAAPADAREALADALRCHRVEVDGRLAVLRFAAVLCTCAPWRDHAPPGAAPQSECPVHEVVMLTIDGRLL